MGQQTQDIGLSYDELGQGVHAEGVDLCGLQGHEAF